MLKVFIHQLLQMDNHLSRPEVVDAKDENEGYASRYSSTLKTEFIYFVKQVDQNQFGFKYIRIAQSLKSVENLATKYREFYYLIIAIIIFVIIVAWLVFNSCLTYPISELTKAVNFISHGDLKRSVAIRTGVMEIDYLAYNMNIMTIALERGYTGIKRMEKVRSEFLGNVTHELKTPISSTSGYIETLLEGAINDKTVNIGFLERALENAHRLEELVTDLVEISRIETGELKMNFEHFNIFDILKNLIKDAKQRNTNKKIKIDLDLPDKKLFVYGDKSRLDQVISNLLSNSLRYTDEGYIKLKANRRDDEIVFSIIDTGIGITQKAIKRIFERFYRTDKARDRQKGGTGLGLSIAKHIIEAHGSKVYVDTVEGKGSTFSFGVTTINPEK